MPDNNLKIGGESPTVNIGPASSTPAPSASPTSGSASLSGASFFNKTETKSKGPKMIESIVSGSNTAAKLKPILGNAPTLQKTLEQEREIRMKKKLRLVQILSVLVFVMVAGMAFYFYSELSPGMNLFGSNTTERLKDANTNLRSLQTQLNKYRYLAAQVTLDRFSFVADQYMDKMAKISDPSTPVSVTTELSADVAELQNEMPQLLKNAREYLSPDIVIATTRSDAEEEITDQQILLNAQSDLKAALTEDKKQMTSATQANQTTADLQNLKLIDNTMKLVGNNKLLTAIKSASTDGFSKDLADYTAAPDAVKRQNLQNFMSTVLASTKSDIATIGSLKNDRIQWASIMKHIEEETTKIDANFRGNKSVAYETVGGIAYVSYEFETNTQKLILTGMTKTTDGSNFTLLSKLIDTLELSAYFKDVEERSFSKSGAPETGYESNFKIEMKLEGNEVSSKTKPISLVRDILLTKSGFKRLR